MRCLADRKAFRCLSRPWLACKRQAGSWVGHRTLPPTWRQDMPQLPAPLTSTCRQGRPLAGWLNNRSNTCHVGPASCGMTQL